MSGTCRDGWCALAGLLAVAAHRYFHPGSRCMAHHGTVLRGPCTSISPLAGGEGVGRPLRRGMGGALGTLLQ